MKDGPVIHHLALVGARMERRRQRERVTRTWSSWWQGGTGWARGGSILEGGGQKAGWPGRPDQAPTCTGDPSRATVGPGMVGLSTRSSQGADFTLRSAGCLCGQRTESTPPSSARGGGPAEAGMEQLPRPQREVSVAAKR